MDPKNADQRNTIVNPAPSRAGGDQSSTINGQSGLGTSETVRLESDATSYSSSAHWTSILDGISELRDVLDEIPLTSQSSDSNPEEIRGPDLLFSQQRHASLNEILAAVPNKMESDNLIATYFQSMDIHPTIIHRPTFERQYDEFWKNPSETPVMWIGLLFSLFALAIRFNDILETNGLATNEAMNFSIREAKMDHYREKIVQCLILANYTKCPPHTVETFLQYFITEYFRSSDTQFGTWMLIGILVRIAFRMGYHREPSRFPNISLFQAEMRRRTWSMITQLDLMSSSQMGLPRAIQASMQDVREPRHLKDEDLHEDMTELPPARPLTETTGVLLMLVRNRVHGVFSRIVDLNSSNKHPPYEQVMELDAFLRKVYDDLPPTLKAIRPKELTTGEINETMRRLYMGLNFFKAEITLHRPYHLLGRVDSRYQYSRSVCINAALEILELQKILDVDTRPGRRLWAGRYRLWSSSWRLSAIVNHDFLLATTILSLELDKDTTSPMPPSEDFVSNRFQLSRGQPTRADIIESLQGAYTIWIKNTESSREAKKVAAAVKLVLSRAGALDVDTDTPAAETSTPVSHFDFASYTRPIPPMEFGDSTFNPTFYDLQNPHLSLPFPDDNNTMDMSGIIFDWGGFGTEMEPPNFQQNFQNSYVG